MSEKWITVWMPRQIAGARPSDHSHEAHIRASDIERVVRQVLQRIPIIDESCEHCRTLDAVLAYWKDKADRLLRQVGFPADDSELVKAVRWLMERIEAAIDSEPTPGEGPDEKFLDWGTPQQSAYAKVKSLLPAESGGSEPGNTHTTPGGRHQCAKCSDYSYGTAFFDGLGWLCEEHAPEPDLRKPAERATVAYFSARREDLPAAMNALEQTLGATKCE